MLLQSVQFKSDVLLINLNRDHYQVRTVQKQNAGL